MYRSTVKIKTTNKSVAICPKQGDKSKKKWGENPLPVFNTNILSLKKTPHQHFSFQSPPPPINHPNEESNNKSIRQSPVLRRDRDPSRKSPSPPDQWPFGFLMIR